MTDENKITGLLKYIGKWEQNHWDDLKTEVTEFIKDEKITVNEALELVKKLENTNSPFDKLIKNIFESLLDEDAEYDEDEKVQTMFNQKIFVKE